jgi:peptidoglycan/xylan/chitin deacetylase (PgdA/CDA1 family)
MTGTITYKLEGGDDFTRYVLDFIFTTLGLRSTETDSDTADLYYGNAPASSDYAVVIPKNRSDVLWDELLSGKVNSTDMGKILPFDLVNAVGYFLADVGNIGLTGDHYDEHGRLKSQYSFQASHELGNVPIVNVYISFLRELLELRIQAVGTTMWPEGNKCAIALSHDVDYPYLYAGLGAPWVPRNAGLKAKLLVRRMLDRNPDRFWLFNDIMNVEEAHGCRSTFLFATTNRYSDWGSPEYDVAYDADTGKFRNVMGQISQRGFEIGLHASYNAYVEASRFIAEKEKLEELTGRRVTGLRHHYWHVGPAESNTLALHEWAGFDYDSSLAFNDDMGFRRNVAFPYYPWYEPERRPLNVMQLPVFCMDGNLFYHQVTVEKALSRLKAYIETIKRYGGLGVIDWHVRTSYPKNPEYSDWGHCYVKLLELLSSDPEIWMTNLQDTVSHLKQREQSMAGNP